MAETNKDSNETSLIKSSSEQIEISTMDTKTKEFLATMANFEKLADYIASSDVYSNNFKVAKRDADGKVIKDENGEIIEVVNKGDIVACMVLGNEMGISPMGSISLGKQLNANAYKKAMRGKSLGLDPMTAMSVVYIIPSSNGDVFTTGIHVISQALINCKTKIDILQDFATTNIYYVLEAGVRTDIYLTEEEYQNNLDKYYNVIEGISTKEVLRSKLEEGCTLVSKKATKITTVRLTRKQETITVSYTLQDAIDAGLYKGIASDKSIVKGKDNWNSNPATMLRNRCITIPGRIIASDVLHNTYLHDEMDIINQDDDTHSKFNQIPTAEAVED